VHDTIRNANPIQGIGIRFLEVNETGTGSVGDFFLSIQITEIPISSPKIMNAATSTTTDEFHLSAETLSAESTLIHISLINGIPAPSAAVKKIINAVIFTPDIIPLL
jgi:hypothetical protein